MIARKCVFLTLFVSILISIPILALAQSEQGEQARVFGLGQPAAVKDLPPGQLKRKLLDLPPKAQAKALRWLQDFSFPEADVATLDVDPQGGIFYADTLTVDSGQQAADGAAPTAEEAPGSTLDNAFLLHSRPGAPNIVFLDFDGHDISGTAWNSAESIYNAKPYNLDSDPNSFSTTERERIVDIWHRVAEDLAPFDIDVTTEDPGGFGPRVGHVLITASTDEQGRSMPSSGGGGVAYVNVFGRSDYHTRYSPALVYFDNLGGGASTYVAEASSHELGHNLGLSHDGAPGTTYYQGHGSGLVSWAPIMGNSYYNNVTQWSKGEYTGANQTQDDLAIIDAKLGTAGDDHGDSIGDATALMVGGDGSVVSSNPEFDPDNLLPENKGIIGSSADVDVFSFLSGAGAVDLVVTPAWDAFYRATTRRGANLDVQLELRDAGGAVVASSDPLNDTSASISTTVAAGTWFLAVTGVGNANTPYSDYDSLGMYFINGSVPQAVADNTAPNPNPMQFASAPVAAGENSISMAAVAATDDLGAVQYQFKCVAGGPQGCINSGWQAGESYTATGLAAATQYTFTVEARDTAGNVTDPSSPMSATTEEPPPPPPYQEFVANGETLVAGTVSGSYSATHADDNSVQSILERESGGKKNDRYTYLEHRWSFSLAQGISATAFVNAWKDGANAGESFELEYSVDGGGNWRSLLTVSSTSSGNTQVAEIPDAPSGNVLLRFVDNQQQAGNRALSTLYVDHLYIQVANTEVEPPGNPPDGDPDGFTATAASSSQINLAWTDQSSNESGYLLERSPDGTTNWVVVADLAAGTEAFSDAGRDAATQYFYRVSAYNVNGSSAYAYADATTDTPQAFNLQASGYKDKGKQKVQLDWTGDGAVDVYRDGGIVASAVSGNSYLDNIDLKGSGSYEHRVCEAGAETVCSNVTTTVF